MSPCNRDPLRLSIDGDRSFDEQVLCLRNRLEYVVVFHLGSAQIQFLSITDREFRQGQLGHDSRRSGVIRTFEAALFEALGDGPRVHFAPGTEDPHYGQGDGDVLQGIARDVGFHLVHDVGVEDLPVV